MKRLLLSIFTVFVFVSSSNAQSTSGDFTLAPQIGLNLSRYSSSENLINSKVRTSFNAGVIAEYYFNDRWSLRSGLIYDSKGSKILIFGPGYVEKLNYLAVPLHANWHFGSNRNWFLNFGPTLGFLISAKSDDEIDGEIDIKDGINSTFDIGLAIGLGYKFDIADNTQLYIQYQGYSGFLSLIDNFNLFNATSAFNVGVIFQL